MTTVATIGMMVSLGGVSGALLALRRFRGDACPACEAFGSLAPLRVEAEEIPGCAQTAIRSRRCVACGATVEDRHPLTSTTPGSSINRVRQYLARQ